jgi:vacuolar-type H+-ATPase subunit H
MTKIIYINWENREIVTNAKEKERWVDKWIDDNAFSCSFEEWLQDYHNATEIYYMTAEEKAKLPMHYDEYLKDNREYYARKAEKVFSEEFKEIGIEVNRYAD